MGAAARARSRLRATEPLRSKKALDGLVLPRSGDRGKDAFRHLRAPDVVRTDAQDVAHRCPSVAVELCGELLDARRDVVADRAHVVDRFVLRVGELPADVALARNDRTRVVACGDDDVGPLDRLVVELPGYVVGGVDTELGQRLE